MSPPTGFTHLDPSGRPQMVDVSEKSETRRESVARGRVLMRPETLAAIETGQIQKGDVLATAQVAAGMAGKGTRGIMPPCRPLRLTGMSCALDRVRARREGGGHGRRN